MDERRRELERRAREGDLRAACALERELARAGGARSFDARGLLAVLREDGREVTLSFGDVTLTARRRGQRAVLRAWGRAPGGRGLPASFTSWLQGGWSDEDFVATAGRLYAHAVAASSAREEPKPTPAPLPRRSDQEREAMRRRDRESRAREIRNEIRRARFLRRLLG